MSASYSHGRKCWHPWNYSSVRTISLQKWLQLHMPPPVLSGSPKVLGNASLPVSSSPNVSFSSVPSVTQFHSSPILSPVSLVLPFSGHSEVCPSANTTFDPVFSKSLSFTSTTKSSHLSYPASLLVPFPFRNIWCRLITHTHLWQHHHVAARRRSSSVTTCSRLVSRCTRPPLFRRAHLFSRSLRRLFLFLRPLRRPLLLQRPLRSPVLFLLCK